MDRPEIIAAFALSAGRAGAAGVRINRPENIRAARATVTVPIIGIFKQIRPGTEVYITPSLEAAEAVGSAGASVIALDATPRRPGGYEAVAELIAAVRRNTKLPVMADVGSLEDGLAAAAAGADLIATTLLGYTAETRGTRLPGLDLVACLSRRLPVPVLCEGGIGSPDEVAAAFQAGAYAVVVGTALTGIEARVKRFAAACPHQGPSPDTRG